MTTLATLTRTHAGCDLNRKRDTSTLERVKACKELHRAAVATYGSHAVRSVTHTGAGHARIDFNDGRSVFIESTETRRNLERARQILAARRLRDASKQR